LYRTSIYVILANSGSMSGAGAGIQPAAVIPAPDKDIRGQAPAGI